MSRAKIESRFVPKVWGVEHIFAATEHYCGKLLHFRAGSRSSLHYHRVKDESWYVVTGEFWLEIDDETMVLRPGDALRLKPGTKHRLTCCKQGTIFEVSTHDDPDDCVRIELSEALSCSQ